MISIHALQAESDLYLLLWPVQSSISIHALQAESDSIQRKNFKLVLKFQSTLSKRRATGSFPLLLLMLEIFQSTLSKRRATSASVHTCVSPLDFNPRSPSGERLSTTSYGFPLYLFQSTLSKRRATLTWSSILNAECYFNPRSPSGERHRNPVISSAVLIFQSTLSKRRATRLGMDVSMSSTISIHALQAESDSKNMHFLPE